VVGTFYGPRTPEPLAAALHTLATTEPDALDDVRELAGSLMAVPPVLAVVGPFDDPARFEAAVIS
jgi:hypothetical protein